SGAPKLAYRAFNWAARAIGTPVRTVSSTGVLGTSQGSFESYAFTGGSNCSGGPCYTIVAWAVGSTSPTARVRAAPELRAYDLEGNAVNPVGRDGVRDLYDLTASPVFFQRNIYYSVLIPLAHRNVAAN